MPSITTWTRLEPRPRDATLRASLQAQVHDPLWLLARQWQLAEFKGENGGSAVQAMLTYESAVVDTYIPRPGAGLPASPYAPADIPLEALVEVESGAPDEGAARRRAEAGLELIEALSPSLRERYGALFTAEEIALEAPKDTPDPGSRAFFALMAGRVPDGAKLRGLLPADPNTPIDWQQSPPVPGVAQIDQGELGQALSAWSQWYDAQINPSGGAWDPERLAYRFAVTASAASASGAPTALALTAAEYTGGELDWYAFDAEQDAATKRLGQPIPLKARPTAIQFPGMPAPRFWAFEPAAVDFGALETAPTDLARMLCAEFALVYGNDFFMIPIELNVGTVTRVVSLEVVDTFGELHGIPAASKVDLAGAGGAGAPWRLFSLSTGASPTASEDLLFLAPKLTGTLYGRPLEEVAFMRDEMANCAWAVERLVTGAGGRPYERFEDYQGRRQQRLDAEEADGPGDGTLAYELFTPAPDYWVPLLPRKPDPATRPVMLKLRQAEPIVGAVLAAYLGGDAPLIYEDEIPRSGMLVTREPQLARWVGGRTFAWIGRRRQTGPGEGASGLSFDVLAPSKAE